jgi:hypothetical protein
MRNALPDRILVTSTLPRSLRATGRLGLVFVFSETGSDILYWRTDE